MKEQIRTQAGMAQARQHQGGPLSLISCVSGREASPLSENDPRETSEMKSGKSDEPPPKRTESHLVAFFQKPKRKDFTP